VALLKQLENEMKKCVKCGVCRAHCPVFTELRREPAVARGKVSLARAVLAGSIELDDRTYADMSKCLLCGTCVEKCPNDVPSDMIVIAAREALADKRGLTSFHTAVRRVLRKRLIMKAGACLAAMLTPFFFRKVPVTSGLRLRFPIPFVPRNRFFPKIASKPFIGRHSEVIQGEIGKPVVLFFTGCMANFVFPGIGEAALDLLSNLGCTVIIPRDQQCCGFPAMSGGDTKTLAELAEKNLHVFEKFQADHIMTACASCGSALKEYYPGILAKIRPDLAGRLSAVAGKVVDAEVLLHSLGFEPVNRENDTKVVITYHDPCHLRRRKVTAEPRNLLRSLPCANFVEMEQAGECCGLGGTFSAYHYGISMSVNSRKRGSIIKSGADVVLTGCPGCIIQISDGLRQGGFATKVMHTLEMLANTGNRGR
jgi:glycolate oxidase iron-sulfur subunit